MFPRRARVLAAAILVIAAVAWMLVNNPVEGRVLLVLTPNHGLTQADLPALGVLLVAALLLLSARR